MGMKPYKPVLSLISIAKVLGNASAEKLISYALIRIIILDRKVVEFPTRQFPFSNFF